MIELLQLQRDLFKSLQVKKIRYNSIFINQKKSNHRTKHVYEHDTKAKYKKKYNLTI